MTPTQAQEEAKKHLSEKRYIHTQYVAEMAKSLAARFGASEEKAELAGWLHDVTKEKSRDVQLQLLGQDAIMAGCTSARPLPVWHGTTAAIYAKHTLGVQDEEVLSAIACHTTGKAGMSLLDKIIFLADATSGERTFSGVAEIRKVAQTNLDAAVTMVMEENVAYLTRAGKPLDEHTLHALEYIKKSGVILQNNLEA